MYQIAIIGAGPAGLSAAARAAARDQQARRSSPSYVLLEGFSAHAKTIQRYQKGKHVMAEPGFLDLRSDLGFGAGSREKILSAWGDGLRELNVNIRHNAEVKKIGGAKGAFAIQLTSGETIQAAHVVLAIGLEGNPRKLGAPGEDLERVQYQLDDPKEFANETILVVGAGDSAIENALALAEQNDVWILNRGKEFSRAKDANLNAVVAAITDPRRRLNCYYETSIKSVTQGGGAMPLTVVMQTPAGEKTVQCHRIIARLGAIPPRKFVESIGIKFPNERNDAIPELSRHYESNVPGVYIIGSLAGYPLIKQAMNQGYDVIEFINGNDVKPADHPLLEYQFFGLPFERSVDEIVERFQTLIPMFRQMNALAFRELVIESDLLVAFPAGAEFDDARKRMTLLQKKLALKDPQPRMTRVIREGEVIYQPGEFGTSFFTIVDGEVLLEATGGQKIRTRLGRGEFFGEMSLLSGRPRLEKAVAGPGCILVETPRRTMLKLMNSNEEVRSGIDWIFIVRELQRHFAPYATLRELRSIATRVTLRRLKAGEVLFSEGDVGDSLFVLRSGAITLLRRQGDEDKLVSQVRSGQLIGEMALMGDPMRRETATANVAAELIEIKRREFLELTRRDDARLDPLQKDVSRRVVDNARMQVRPEAGTLMNFLMDEGLGEATNVLVIDEALCVGCDNCEKACAETHEGVSRLDREAGATFANIHIPISCRHCEQPHCMKDCPPNALRRSESGEVYINDTCIGCGNCEANCPYGVIRMVYDAPKKPGLVSWMIFAAGSGPGEEPDYKPSAKAKDKGKKATKCDACVGLKGGPACVRACPTGAAIRIGPEQFIDLVEERKR
ncbi:cyclic nucleotide-binding domain-containing protein [Peristeroidobacter agariperforans]|uniref:cyclic nucleotide-binding domain-containing protein n=1 Tax=Peristeroidobacter agariperforans TaxID=268404 RepID=UPI00101DCD04|nr:cyclic nucleotide-binding domain-containing protein [Peristeroidobacter agariperforans]